MKTLVIVSGPPGVGKTSVCQELYKLIPNSAWLDGDWCWMMNPFVVNEENKAMVEQNIAFMLRSLLSNSSVQTVVLSWVVPREEVFERILAPLLDLRLHVHRITLVCKSQVLEQRMEAGGRPASQVASTLQRLATYQGMCTRKVDCTDLTPEGAARAIKCFL